MTMSETWFQALASYHRTSFFRRFYDWVRRQPPEAKDDPENLLDGTQYWASRYHMVEAVMRTLIDAGLVIQRYLNDDPSDMSSEEGGSGEDVGEDEGENERKTL